MTGVICQFSLVEYTRRGRKIETSLETKDTFSARGIRNDTPPAPSPLLEEGGSESARKRERVRGRESHITVKRVHKHICINWELKI